MEASHVEVSVTFRDAAMTTTLTKDSLAYLDHDETEAALLHDLVTLARLDLRVEEEDVWTFGKEFETEASDD